VRKIFLGTILAVNAVLLIAAGKILITEFFSPISGVSSSGRTDKAERKLSEKKEKSSGEKKSSGEESGEKKKDIKNIKRDKNAAYISINSQPSGAKVFVNGYFKSKTPADIKITSVTGAPKQFSIKLRMEGYRDWEKLVTLTKTSTKEFSVNLKKQ